MFEAQIRPELLEACGAKVVTKRFKFFGQGESSLVSRLGDKMRRGRNPLINCTVDLGVITLHVTGTGQTAEEAADLVEQDEQFLRKTVGDLMFGTDDENLGHVVGRGLLRQQASLAVAESCTGGLVAKLLTDVPGASGVPKKIIEAHGAVSEPVAEAMALGAVKNSGAEYAIGVTGIAGPTGGTESKPVGQVFIGTASPRGCRVKAYLFTGDRATIRLRAAQSALHQLWKGFSL